MHTHLRIRYALPLLALIAGSGALSASLSASDALVDIAVAPSARVVERFAATPYGKVWADPALKPLHDAIDEARTKNTDEMGIDIVALLLGQRGAGLRLLGITADSPVYAWNADLGDLAADVAAKAKAAGGETLEAAGADDAWSEGDLRLARFGTVLRGAGGGDGFPSWKPENGDDDLVISADLRALCQQGAAAFPKVTLDPAVTGLIAKLGEARVSMRLGREDVESRFHARWPTAGLLPLSRERLAHVPANALEVSALGLDGAAWWAEFGAPILSLVSASSQDEDGERRIATAAAAQAVADEALASAGLPPLPELIGALKGTMVVFTTPGAPFPGYTFVFTRTPALDATAKALLAKLGLEPPVEGAAAVAIPVPNVPIMPQVLVTKDELVLTTDPMLGSAWPPSGWSDSISGKAVLGHVDDHTVVLSASDTAAQLRMFSGMAGLFLGNIPDLTAPQKQATMTALTKLAAVATPAWSVASTTVDGIDGDARGVGSSGSLAVVAVVAAIAIPNLLESRVVSQESAAAAALKSGILPAEVQFQNGGYVDQDGNGIGEYGFISEMVGQVDFNGAKLNLLAPSYERPEHAISGYHFAVYLPDGDGAMSEPYPDKRPDSPVGERERRWIAYAWPADKKQGRRMFAIDQAGNVYTELWKGEPPEWNALYGGAGWDGEKTWKPYRRKR